MVSRRVLAPLLALVLVSSGCIGGLGGAGADAESASADQAAASRSPDFTGPVDVEEVSAPTHDLGKVVESFVPMGDGTRLHTVEYHPEDVNGSTPVVINLSPYFGNLDEAAVNGTMEDYYVGLLVSRGYTVVRASVRGTGHSEDCFRLGGPREIQDAAKLVETYHKKEWSNGNVALVGVSYPGTTPWQAAITDPPGLKTIVPIEGISDMYKYDHHEGASYNHGPAFPTYYTALVDWTQKPDREDGADQLAPLAEFACPGVADRIAEGYETMESGVHDAFWDKRNYESRLDDVDVPVFLVHGFQDWNVDPDNGVPIFDQLPEESKAWLGQWEHNIPFENTHNEEWDRHDWNLTLVAWFDRWLKGEENGITERKPVLAQDDEGHWFRSETWPPRGRENQTLYLAEDQALQAEAPEGATATMAKDPSNAATTSTQPRSHPERLTFVSEPLEERVVMAGRPTVELEVATDRPDGHLVAYLHDVDADGGPKELGHAILNLAQRDSRNEETPMPAGEPQDVNMTFYPMNAHVPEGHRLQLTIQPEAGDRIIPSEESPTYRIQLGGDDPAQVTFPDLDSPDVESAPDVGEVPWSK